jgi:hypothetical protein
MRPRLLLPVANLVASLLFVALREPARAGYLAELDAARRVGGWYMESGVDGMVACRELNSWSSFHGGESPAVMVLEAVNLPALVATGMSSIALDAGLAVADREGAYSSCALSWIMAGAFLVFASGQWYLVGWLLERVRQSTNSAA